MKLELELGRHRELVGELTELVEEYPLQRAAARAAHARPVPMRSQGGRAAGLPGRQCVLIDELGMEPDKRLQQLEQAILTSDPVLDRIGGPSRSQPARHLVPSCSPLTSGISPAGRSRCSRLAGTCSRRRVTRRGSRFRSSRWTAREASARPASRCTRHTGWSRTFPDGQLFADLHGNSRALTPMEVLGRFLRAFGLSGSENTRCPRGAGRGIPGGDSPAGRSWCCSTMPRARPRWHRSCPAARPRRSLSPAAGGWPDWPGAAHVDVDVFDASGSVELFFPHRRGSSASRWSHARRPGHRDVRLSPAGPADRRRAPVRPAALEHPADGRPSLRRDPPPGRAEIRRHGGQGGIFHCPTRASADGPGGCCVGLAILDAPLISAWVAAALLESPLSSAQDLLDELVECHLLEVADDRYRLRDLTRLFSRERLAAEEPAFGRKAALERVQASRRRTRKNVTAISAAARATKMPVSMNWNGQNR